MHPIDLFLHRILIIIRIKFSVHQEHPNYCDNAGEKGHQFVHDGLILFFVELVHALLQVVAQEGDLFFQRGELFVLCGEFFSGHVV